MGVLKIFWRLRRFRQLFHAPATVRVAVLACRCSRKRAQGPLHGVVRLWQPCVGMRVNSTGTALPPRRFILHSDSDAILVDGGDGEPLCVMSMTIRVL